mmetsp:Transcript_13718/g.28161  ORF Transcript_13718/g.28161 Transcript_13718/m.28161 type:complete len:341 (+) Transcript_13718:425-1447(+)
MHGVPSLGVHSSFVAPVTNFRFISVVHRKGSRCGIPSCSMSRISSNSFYSEFYGHRVEHLEQLDQIIGGGRPRVWLVGDSSLDNKYWILNRAWQESCNGYQLALEPPRSVPDVCHWMNFLLEQRQSLGDYKIPPGPQVCINAAVEASTVRSRLVHGLLPQDELVRDRLSQDDTLVISVGGNDIALSPTILTVVSMLCAVYGNSLDRIKNDPDRIWGMRGILHVFLDQVQQYVDQIISKTKPKKVVVCSLYFLLESSDDSWASLPLRILRYNHRPEILKELIRAVHRQVNQRISFDGTVVRVCPLFDAMNSQDPADYVARVEPSVEGGRKIAELILDYIDN